MRQGSLFDLLPTENPEEAIGLVGVMPSIRAEMGKVAASYGPGRKLLVDAIIKVAKREGVALTSGGAKTIEPATLDKWLQAGERGHAPLLEAICCFCLATGDASPIKPLLKVLGLVAIPQQDLDVLEYGRICAFERDLRNKKKKVEARL